MRAAHADAARAAQAYAACSAEEAARRLKLEQQIATQADAARACGDGLGERISRAERRGAALEAELAAMSSEAKELRAQVEAAAARELRAAASLADERAASGAEPAGAAPISGEEVETMLLIPSPEPPSSRHRPTPAQARR